MNGAILNLSGHVRRKPTDNAVIKSGDSIEYEGKIIDYDPNSSSWILNGRRVGSLSNLSKVLGLNRETHDIGFYLERHGYIFETPFEWTTSKPMLLYALNETEVDGGHSPHDFCKRGKGGDAMAENLATCKNCKKNHRSYSAAAKCKYGLAYQMGEGPYATLHYDNAQGQGLLVYLHPTREAAREFIRSASEGHEGGLLANSNHNGIWCFTRDGRWQKIE